MTPYRTSFMRVGAMIVLLISLSFFMTERAKASCGYFSFSTQDSSWSFTAAAGSTQSRTLIITNTSDSSIYLTSAISGTSRFGLSWTKISLAAHDTVSLIITFQPSSTVAAGTVYGTMTVAKYGTDCHQSLGIVGTVPTTNSGHDKVVTITPSSEDFPAVPAGQDTCMVMYLVNYTGSQVKIESMSLLNGNPDFKIDPAFTTGSMDSGGYYRFKVCCTGDANHTEFSDSLIVTYSDGSGLHRIHAILVGHTSSNTSGAGDQLVADPHAFSFGSVSPDSTVCRSVIVKNTGTHAIVMAGWNQCDSKDFSISPAFTSNDTLAAGSSMTFTICYTPVASDSGAKDCNLTIDYYAGSTGGTLTTLVVGFYGIRAGSNTTGGNTACIRTEQGSNYHDAVVVGGSANHTLYLINPGTTNITLNTFDIYGPDASSFSINTNQFPITVPANSTNTTLIYTFTPTSNSKTEYTAKAAFSLSGDRPQSCDSAYAYLVGYTVHSTNTVDTVVRPLFPTEPRTLGLEGNGATVSTTFYFTNNLNVDCTVNKIWLADGTYFKISSTNPSPTPFTLHPGDNLSVIVTYTATDNHVHHDSLMIDANHNLQAQSFELQGVQIAAKVAGALPDGVAINVSPNPASNYLTVNLAGIRSADIQIIDLLGNTIATAKSTTMWKWNASGAATGSYIVRIAGTSNDGEKFVASKRVILSK